MDAGNSRAVMFVGVTDFLDGYLARRFDQVTTLGKVLDPVADRVVLVTGVLAIEIYGAVPPGSQRSCSAANCSSRWQLSRLLRWGQSVSTCSGWEGGHFGLLCCFPLFLLGTNKRRGLTC